MTMLFVVLAYVAAVTGIMVFFRFVRAADHVMREITVEAPEFRPAQAVARYHRQSA